MLTPEEFQRMDTIIKNEILPGLAPMNDTPKNPITQIILKLREAYQNEGHVNSVREINEGLCVEFAEEVIRQLGGATDQRTNVSNDWFDELDSNPTIPYHAWIIDDSMHYDAECPNGVVHYQELPFFKRIKEHLRNGGKRSCG